MSFSTKSVSLPGIHKQGYVFIAAAFLFSCVSFAFSFGLGVISASLTVLCVYFFRDPVRVIPLDNRLVVSSSDGVVTAVSKVESPIEPGKMVTRVSVFLSPLNVHVNRVPVSGVVKSVEYCPGNFSIACSKDAITENEKVRSVIESSVGNHLVVVEQIAGVLARRIVCDLEAEQDVEIGARLGIIKFGSGVNVYIPEGFPVFVSQGHTVVAGETLISDLGGEVKGLQELVFKKL